LATLSTLISFNYANGANPFGSLIMDADGNLFGTASQGGNGNGTGTVFEIAKAGVGYSSTPVILASFGGSNGAYPMGTLVADASGNLFGTTQSGGPDRIGAVFELVNSGGGSYTLTTLVNFHFTNQGNNTSNGTAPSAGLIIDANGDLFGTTVQGGSNNEGQDGTVFEVLKTADGYAGEPVTLFNFDGTNGQGPSGSLIADAQGNLFGTTAYGAGGAGLGSGTVFELVNNGGGAYTLNTLVKFNDTGTGENRPLGDLIADANGDLFGTVAKIDVSGSGAVFELVNNGGSYTFTTIATFPGADNGGPTGSLIADAQGNLFGTTLQGGANGDGAVFEIAKTADGYSSTPITLVEFDGTNGIYPRGSLIADAAGNLYGTTSLGGANGQGTVFEITDSGFEVACFCRGTMILTEIGEVPVEQLAVGDRVLTLSGAAEPITWIGRGRRLLTATNREIRPIIVRRGALSDNVPCRDLYLTRGHSLYLDGVLIPVEYLVNGSSIRRDDIAREVEFYHIELAAHDVLIADGAPAESYREDENRHVFDNADRPRFTTADTAWFAPVVTSGPDLDRNWRRLFERSGVSLPAVTDDPDLHLRVDGVSVDADRVAGRQNGFHGTYRFPLVRTPASLAISSRSVVPMEIGLCRDPRRLGVAVRSVELRGPGCSLRLDYDCAWLSEGFNAPEPALRGRWTDGLAPIPQGALALFPDGIEITIEVCSTTRYAIDQVPWRDAA
jgi:uncharacterized repeat protein (TIGR03803 family)